MNKIVGSLLLVLLIGCVSTGVSYAVRRQVLNTGGSPVVCPNNNCDASFSIARGWPLAYKTEPLVANDAAGWAKYGVKTEGIIGDVLVFSALSFGVLIVAGPTRLKARPKNSRKHKK